MPGTTLSSNMSLPVPQVGIESGPQYATDVNNCLTIIDAHNHSSGSGVPITPSGLNISSDLTFFNNNAISLRSVRFQPQGSTISGASDLTCLYAAPNGGTGTYDLFFNDGSGNQIPITKNGAITGSPGTIANLVSPASASYVPANSTFVWESAATTAANMDAGSIILRKLTPSSPGLTLSPPAAIASDYSIVLPLLPASTKILRIDSSGNITSTLDVDNSTIEISSNLLQLKDSGITGVKIASATITNDKLATPAGSSTIFTSTGTYTVPTGITKLLVQGRGGSGGGGGAAGLYNSGTLSGNGGGGGCGCITQSRIITVTSGASYTVTIGAGGGGGAGGAPGNNGSNGGGGGASSFGSIVSFSGGPGGFGGSTTLGGAGGITGAGMGGVGGNGSCSHGTTTQDVSAAGYSVYANAGAPGVGWPTYGTGGGGGAGDGDGGAGATANGSFGVDGSAGTNGGGGGGGASSSNNISGGAGGAGTDGIVIVTILG